MSTSYTVINWLINQMSHNFSNFIMIDFFYESAQSYKETQLLLMTQIIHSTIGSDENL